MAHATSPTGFNHRHSIDIRPRVPVASLSLNRLVGSLNTMVVTSSPLVFNVRLHYCCRQRQTFALIAEWLSPETSGGQMSPIGALGQLPVGQALVWMRWKNDTWTRGRAKSNKQLGNETLVSFKVVPPEPEARGLALDRAIDDCKSIDIIQLTNWNSWRGRKEGKSLRATKPMGASWCFCFGTGYILPAECRMWPLWQ